MNNPPHKRNPPSTPNIEIKRNKCSKPYIMIRIFWLGNHTYISIGSLITTGLTHPYNETFIGGDEAET